MPQYQVQPGDTLYSIAERLTGNPLNYRRIAAESGLSDPSAIKPGQVLSIPYDLMPASEQPAQQMGPEGAPATQEPMRPPASAPPSPPPVVPPYQPPSSPMGAMPGMGAAQRPMGMMQPQDGRGAIAQQLLMQGQGLGNGQPGPALGQSGGMMAPTAGPEQKAAALSLLIQELKRRQEQQRMTAGAGY